MLKSEEKIEKLFCQRNSQKSFFQNKKIFPCALLQ